MSNTATSFCKICDNLNLDCKFTHNTKNHTTCNFCLDDDHISDEHICERCYNKGHSRYSKCTYCNDKHSTCFHKCSLCNGFAHEEHKHTLCKYCTDNNHTSENHKCTTCFKYGHSSLVNNCQFCSDPHSSCNHICSKCNNKGHETTVENINYRYCIDTNRKCHHTKDHFAYIIVKNDFTPKNYFLLNKAKFCFICQTYVVPFNTSDNYDNKCEWCNTTVDKYIKYSKYEYTCLNQYTKVCLLCSRLKCTEFTNYSLIYIAINNHLSKIEQTPTLQEQASVILKEENRCFSL